MTAARRLQTPVAVAQDPFPGAASTPSIVLFTLKVAERAVSDAARKARGRRERRDMAISFLTVRSDSR